MALALVCWMCGHERSYCQDHTCPECGLTMYKTHIDEEDVQAL